MKLIASDINEVPAGRSGFRMKSVFNTAMENLEASIQPIAQTFKREIDQKIERSLATSLKTGALKGSQEAMSTVHSWGSKSRRTRYERRPDKNGDFVPLLWLTYAVWLFLLNHCCIIIRSLLVDLQCCRASGRCLHVTNGRSHRLQSGIG
jgi:hypothetical protein